MSRCPWLIAYSISHPPRVIGDGSTVNLIWRKGVIPLFQKPDKPGRSHNVAGPGFSNYPNPFNPATTFRFIVNRPGMVQIAIFSVEGRYIETVYNSYCETGWKEVSWNSSSMSSGVYFARFSTFSGTATKKAKIAIMIIAVLFASIELKGQDTGALIINPKISGFTSVPFGEGGIIRRDTLTTPLPDPTRSGSFPKVENAEWPSGALIKGMVPDPSRGWAVAVTHDEEEFQRALPEYRRLLAEGKWRETKEVLHISRSIQVSTKVEQFRDQEKLGELPEKVGTFFFTFGTPEFKKYGGYLTFLTFTPDPDNPVVGIGNDIGETIHGVLQVEATEGDHGFKYGFAMKIIKAEITEAE